MADKPPIRASGVVLLRRRAGTLQTLLIHRPRHGDWSLPKGKTNNGETLLECAVRECWEETGIRPILGSYLGRQSYRVAGRPKNVDYWVARIGRKHRFMPNSEVDATKWVTRKEARSLLTYKRDLEFMEAGFALPTTDALIVVRHATALKRSAFIGDDYDRPLTARGQLQAINLAPILSAYGVTRLISSPAQRCLQTLLPFSTSAGVRIRQEKEFSEIAHQKAAEAAKLRATSLAETRKSIAICSHRPVLPDIFSALTDLRGFDRRLVKSPLRPTSMIVAHRVKRKGKWVIVGTERHEAA